jgi:hypothetical protein
MDSKYMLNTNVEPTFNKGPNGEMNRSFFLETHFKMNALINNGWYMNGY